MPSLMDLECYYPRVLNKKNASLQENENNVYVGRPTKWGNPFVIGKDGTRTEVIEKYREYIFGNEELLSEARKTLKGKNLICWCAPEACHADVLLEIANEKDRLHR